MTDRNPGSPKRFVPSGVDAQSWLGFEHRIQERRFKALVEAINTALAQRDGVAARMALEEARELRPDAPELASLASRVALLPVAPPASASAAYGWYRGLGAVAMFLVGIGLVIGIESFRPAEGEPQPASVVADAAAAPVAVAAPAVTEEPIPASPEATAPPSAVESPVVEAAPSIAAPATAVTREEPVGSARVSQASVDARRVDAPSRATFRTEEARDVEPVVPASREIPDDYVAPRAGSEDRPRFAEAASPGPAIAANVMPQPVSITAPPPTPPVVPAATVATTSVAPRSDNSRVAQVLNQYARAYDRLDPNAARAVWPTVDERALSRAFASLASQAVSFDACDIDVKGTVANASCRGTASYVGKVGSRQARTEPRQWNFQLKLHGDDWKIEKAEASVPR